MKASKETFSKRPWLMKKVKDFFRKNFILIKDTANAFNDDNGIKLSASLSYFTIFSLAPLIIIIISVCGFFFGDIAVRGQIFGQISGFVGNESALQIQEMIKNVKLSGGSYVATTVGIITLILGASGVFAEMQDSINLIWGLKAKPKKGIIRYILNRLLSFSMIGVMGFLLLVSLVVSTFMDLLSHRLSQYLPEMTILLFYSLNIIIVFIIITLLFSFIFKSLPDAKLAWKDTLRGAAFTSILFMVGKLIIGVYLSKSAVASAYGAAGSLILVLVWVYYSAMILYFGAEFTKASALSRGRKIIPNSYSVLILSREVEIEPPAKAK
jgi:membrane protein